MALVGPREGQAEVALGVRGQAALPLLAVGPTLNLFSYL